MMSAAKPKPTPQPVKAIEAEIAATPENADTPPPENADAHGLYAGDPDIAVDSGAHDPKDV